MELGLIDLNPSEAFEMFDLKRSLDIAEASSTSKACCTCLNCGFVAYRPKCVRNFKRL